MSYVSTGYGWECEICPTDSFITFTSLAVAEDKASEHAATCHGGRTEGITVLAVPHECFDDEDDWDA